MMRIGMVIVLMLVVATAAMSAEVYRAASAPAQVVSGPFKATTIAEAKASGVDTGVALSGQVVRMLKANEFLLRDETGELMVFTGEGDLDGMNIVNARVEVTGTISQNLMYTEVEAKTVNILQ